MTQAKHKGLIESARLYCKQELDGWHMELHEQGRIWRVFKRDGSNVFNGPIQEALIFIRGAVTMKREVE